MSKCLHLDLESRSAVDLPKTGAYVYAAHPTTDIWVVRYAFDDGSIAVWFPGDPVPADIAAHVAAGGEIWAHNAAFERVMWRYILGPRYGWPVPKTTQWRCTMVLCYAMGLPGKLERAAPAAGLDVRKDMEGSRVMMQMAKPRGKIKFNPAYLAKLGITTVSASWEHLPHDIVRVGKMRDDGWEIYHSAQGEPLAEIRWWNDPAKLARNVAYCGMDVEVERGLGARLRPLKASELALWHLDQEINDRGVKIDRKLAEAALKIVEQAEDLLDKRMAAVTNFEVMACSNRNQLLAWFQLRGVDVESIKKDILEELLAPDSGIPDDVREAIKLRRASGNVTVTRKVFALLRGESPEDGRAKGLLQFHSAGTGRWGGRRFQPQNLKRPDEENIPLLIDCVATGDYDYVMMAFGDPLAAVADILRGLIIADEGKRIMAADYSAIEGRVLPWLAGEEWKVQAYREFDESIVLGDDGKPLRKKGEKQFAKDDMYCQTASKILGRHITKSDKKERQNFGKVPELAFGYQGGYGAWIKFAKGEALDYSREQVDEIKNPWREAHAMVKQFWYDMETAAVAAVKEPGVGFYAGRIMFKVSGSFLAMRLPSKRFLFYAYPEVRQFEVPWKKRDPEWIECASPEEAAFLYGDDMVEYDPANKRALVYVNDVKDGVTYMTEINESNRAKIVPDDRNESYFARIKTYGGQLVENATQAVARDILAHAMPKLEAAGYPIILTVHDEIVSEVPYGHGTVDEMEAIMCELPEWAAGLPIAAEGFEDVRYRK